MKDIIRNGQLKRTVIKTKEFEDDVERLTGYKGGVGGVFEETEERFECWVKGEKEAGIRLLEKEMKIEGCWSSVISFETVPNLSCPTSIVTLQGRVRILRVFEDIISSLKPQVECLRLRKFEFVNKVVLKVGMRFYDGIYNIVKGNDLRDGGIKSVTSRVNIWMGAIEACSGAGYVLRSIPMTTKLVESFEFLRSALVDDLVSQVVEVGKSLTSQYLVRSHALLEKSSLDELSEKVGTVGQHNELNEDMIKYSEAVESHFMPDPSPDLNAPLEFFKGVVDAVEGGGGDYGDEIIDGVSLEVFRPFMERIFDAPAIRRSGRRQVRGREKGLEKALEERAKIEEKHPEVLRLAFLYHNYEPICYDFEFCYDVGFLIEVFRSEESTAVKLKASFEILRMEEDELKNLLEVVESVREAGGEDENENREVQNMLAAKGIEGLDVELAIILMRKTLFCF
ncbi:hypothetical protein TrVE_jg10453 [Triparma verrucosa]|uniref:Uncharacterized protein n=1 Tax=Triparma verrucosa TaxID=1606542 RepID=A0A9W7CLX7_9STRA|nr:hypothetical protein TrVE_jg10453 [Triparma verrucosa]